MALQIANEEQNGTTVLNPKGDVDLSSSPQLREAVLKACKGASGDVAVRLSGVDYMDSSGVATLVEGLKASQQAGKKFILLAPSASVLKVLQLSRLDSVFDIRETL
ncbi:MAG: anti-sigma factor antagonist [Candidatus Hydrogenedens sp.]|nr:anti-sigma factor antagonist [Candidatus Hydrogenedens sp.]